MVEQTKENPIGRKDQLTIFGQSDRLQLRNVAAPAWIRPRARDAPTQHLVKLEGAIDTVSFGYEVQDFVEIPEGGLRPENLEGFSYSSAASLARKR